MNNPLRIRPIKSPVVAVVALICLMPLCDYASAWSRIGAVEITDHAGKPCFGLPRKERKRIGKTPEVFGVEVHDAITPPLRRQWSFYFAHPASIPFPPRSLRGLRRSASQRHFKADGDAAAARTPVRRFAVGHQDRRHATPQRPILLEGQPRREPASDPGPLRRGAGLEPLGLPALSRRARSSEPPSTRWKDVFVMLYPVTPTEPRTWLLPPLPAWPPSTSCAAP